MQGKTRIRVRYQETDQMGMAYHGNYVVWMEVGRTELFRHEGMPYKEFEDEGVMLPVIEAGCTYKIPIKYDELITVETHISEMTPVRVRCDYRIFNQEGTEAARGFTCHAFVNRQGRPVNAAKKIPQLFHKLEDVLRG